MMDVDESESYGVPEDASNGALENNGYVDPPEFNIKQLDLFDTSSDGRSPEPDLSEEARMKLQRKAAWRPTGCCYDDRMKLHANSEYSDKAHHPEDPRRIEAIMREFKDAGLIFSGSNAELQEILKESPTRWMYRIAARKARKDEICTVHVPSHYDWVEDLASKTAEELRLMTAELDQGRRSLYVGNLTFEASLISCGGAIETCKNVVEGNCKNGIAVIRPPGHHAEHNEALGFCLFNNVCVAARVCQQDYPQKCRKVLILDWDVHHGNGIQNIFYEDPNVLYISLHVYQDGEFYPGQPEIKGVPDGGNDKCGAGAGIGRNVNIGWHDQKMGDGEYMAAFQRIVMPIAREFDPDLVIVAAGFDAAAGDDLGGCLVSPAGYSHMTHMLMSLADGKVAVCLEGGYNLRAISKSALAVAKTLMGEPPMRMAQPPPCPEAAMVLDRVREFQAPYWACMRPGPFDFKKMDREKVNKEVNDLKGVRLDDVVRIYQRRILTQKHKMVSLFVQREKIARHFEDQVLATQGLHMAKQILLIIHDPPELLALPDPIENTVDAKNTWITDGVMPYIDWAVENGFGVIDVNVPVGTPRSANEDDVVELQSTEQDTEKKISELVCYLWDNYLETCDSTDIVVMGVGHSYIGVRDLLSKRDSRHKIRGILNFVNGTLRSVRATETDPDLPSWYRRTSRVYVAANHQCWDDAKIAAKVNKSRFGRVKKSEEMTLNRMMATHREEACDWILDRVAEEEMVDEEG